MRKRLMAPRPDCNVRKYSLYVVNFQTNAKEKLKKYGEVHECEHIPGPEVRKMVI